MKTDLDPGADSDARGRGGAPECPSIWTSIAELINYVYSLEFLEN